MSWARNRRRFVWLLAVASQLSCGPWGDSQHAIPAPSLLEFRIIPEDENRCGADCEAAELESSRMGKVVLWVRKTPDLILERGDVLSLVPTKLSGLSADAPDAVVWTAALKFTPEAARRVEGLGRRLASEERILISVDGEPLDVSYARLVGQMMSVGEFSTRAELVDALGKDVVVEEGSDEAVEVFSPDELAAEREFSERFESSKRMLHRMEEIRRSAAEGKISNDEMIKQLDEVKRQHDEH